MDLLTVFGAYDDFTRNALILMLVSLSIYLLLSAGLFAVPQVGFMAIGAYTAGVLASRYHLPLWLTLAASAVGGALAGLLLGVILARLNGIYLAVATVAFGEIVRVSALNLSFTGGAQGLLDVRPPVNDVLIVCVCVCAAMAVIAFTRTRFGAVVRAMRQDALMVGHQGVNTRLYRVGLFVAAGFLSGTAGGLHAHFNGFVVPGAYSFELLSTLLAACIVGGITWSTGPVLGTFVILLLPQLLTSVAEYRNVIYGALIIAVVNFLPGGLVGGLNSLAGQRGSRLLGLRFGRQPNASGVRLAPVDVGTQPASRSYPLPEHAGLAMEAGAVLLSLDGLSKNFGGVKAVQDVTLDVRRGEMLGLIGPNGSGKTTILNLLSGVYAPAAGSGRMDGQDMALLFGHPHLLASAGIARTFQGIRLLAGESVADNIRIGTYLLHDSKTRMTHSGTAAAAMHQVLDQLGLGPHAGSPVGSLPYGIQRKVEIARALVRHPKLLLLDEPTAGMTGPERDEIFRLAAEISCEGIAVIVVEHDVEVITSYCQRLAVMDFGRLIAVGPAQEVVRQEAVIDAYFGAHTRA